MGRHGGNGNFLVSAGRLVSDLAAFDPDSLAEALCKDCLCIRVDELVL